MEEAPAIRKVSDPIGTRGGKNQHLEVLRFYPRGLNDFALFDDETCYRYHYTMFELSMACESALEHVKSKSIKDETILAINDRTKSKLRGEGSQSWWRNMGSPQVSGRFVAYLNAIWHVSVGSPHPQL